MFSKERRHGGPRGEEPNSIIDQQNHTYHHHQHSGQQHTYATGGGGGGGWGGGQLQVHHQHQNQHQQQQLQQQQQQTLGILGKIGAFSRHVSHRVFISTPSSLWGVLTAAKRCRASHPVSRKSRRALEHVVHGRSRTSPARRLLPSCCSTAGTLVRGGGDGTLLTVARRYRFLPQGDLRRLKCRLVHENAARTQAGYTSCSDSALCPRLSARKV